MKTCNQTNWGPVIIDAVILITAALTGHFWILVFVLFTGDYSKEQVCPHEYQYQLLHAKVEALKRKYED